MYSVTRSLSKLLEGCYSGLTGGIFCACLLVLGSCQQSLVFCCLVGIALQSSSIFIRPLLPCVLLSSRGLLIRTHHHPVSSALTNYICEEPVSKPGHFLNWMDMNLGGTSTLSSSKVFLNLTIA